MEEDYAGETVPITSVMQEFFSTIELQPGIS
jgi:hypothetical protein